MLALSESRSLLHNKQIPPRSPGVPSSDCERNEEAGAASSESATGSSLSLDTSRDLGSAEELRQVLCHVIGLQVRSFMRSQPFGVQAGSPWIVPQLPHYLEPDFVLFKLVAATGS